MQVKPEQKSHGHCSRVSHGLLFVTQRGPGIHRDEGCASTSEVNAVTTGDIEACHVAGWKCVLQLTEQRRENKERKEEKNTFTWFLLL